MQDATHSGKTSQISGQEQTERSWNTQLRDFIARNGLKQAHIAYKSGMDKHRFFRILYGLEPTFDEARRIAAALGIPLNEFHDLDSFALSGSKIVKENGQVVDNHN